MVEVSRRLFRESTQARPELDRMAILHDTAEIELDAARSTYTQALRALAVLLQFAEAEADTLAVRGTIRDAGPPPPSVDDLAKLAVCNRPDVVAYRRGVKRAMADVQLARRERFEDVFLFYTPYAFQNYAYQGLQSATSWSVGGLVSIPLFNRNQGNICAGERGGRAGRDRAFRRGEAGGLRGAAGRSRFRDDRPGGPAFRGRHPRPRPPPARRDLPPFHRGRTECL